MQQDLIKLMQDPQIVYVSGGHLGTVLKAGDYVREIEKFLEGWSNHISISHCGRSLLTAVAFLFATVDGTVPFVLLLKS